VSSLARTYVTEVHDEYRYWPSWTPIRRYSIGDCGTLEDGVFFTKKRSASVFGVSDKALEEEPVQRDPRLRFTSKGGVNVKAQASGGNEGIPGIPQGEVGAQITFTRENATVVAALGVSERRLVDQHRLEEELSTLVRRGTFPPDYVVITDLVVAEAAKVPLWSAADCSAIAARRLPATLSWRSDDRLPRRRRRRVTRAAAARLPRPGSAGEPHRGSRARRPA
jgi:hypothetical protein